MFWKSLGLLPNHTIYILSTNSENINRLISLFSIPYVNSLKFSILQLWLPINKNKFTSDKLKKHTTVIVYESIYYVIPFCCSLTQLLPYFLYVLIICFIPNTTHTLIFYLFIVPNQFLGWNVLSFLSFFPNTSSQTVDILSISIINTFCSPVLWTHILSL